MNDYNPVELVRAAADGDNSGFGNGMAWWIIILFLFAGWGNGFNGNRGGSNVGGDALYPWMENQQNLFTGFGNLSNQMCAGFANAETAATARQMADMQQMFGMQTAMMQGFNAQQAQLAQCCCDNRLATANLQAALAAEACADRAAVSDGVRDLLVNQNANTQRILDKMCDQELYAERRENENLRQKINMMNLAASQNLQTVQLIANNEAQTTALEQYLAPVPRPAYVVQNPNCCQQNFGGCGCGQF
jgi:hypothetical protein